MRLRLVFALCLILIFFSLLVGHGISQPAAAESQTVRSSSSTLSKDNTIDALWWNDTWHYRTPLTVYSGGYERIDVPVEKTINFTSLLNEWGVNATFDLNSVRVVEYNSVGEVLYEVPSQLDKAADYDANFNAVGSVAWILNGTTPAETLRSYCVYFDVLENGPKEEPDYTGVLHTISGNYVFLWNEEINVTIRYRMNGTYMEELYLDKNENGIFEPNEEMIGEDNFYRLLVRVSDAEQQKHGWASPFFEAAFEQEANLTILRDGPVLKEIEFSNVSLRDSVGEALNITVKLTFKLYRLSKTVYVKTILNVNEDLVVGYAYEYDFLNHKDLYDRWYVDENYNGNFTFAEGVKWFFSGVPTQGFLSCYNSSGNGGIGFIPNTGYQSAFLGEYRDEGPVIRLFHTPSDTLWTAGKEIELENRLFVYLGDWSEVKEEAQSINNPPEFVNKLQIHLVDYNGEALSDAEVKIYDSLGNLVRRGRTNSTGRILYTIGLGSYTIRAFWMGVQVADQAISISNDVTIDPLQANVYNLTVHTLSGEGKETNEVSVGVYLFNGTLIASSQTTYDGSVSFGQLPGGEYLLKTYYLGEEFGRAAVTRLLDGNAEATVYEAFGLGPPQQIRYDVLYGLIIVGFAAVTGAMLLTKRFEKVKLGLLVSILIFVVLLAGGYAESYPFIQGSPSKGISVVYDNLNGFITVGDVLNVRWKDSDKDGKLDDWSLFIATSNGTELVKIDLLSSLVTPEGTYQLYEADTKTVSYFDVAANEYVLWKAKSQMPLEDEHYHRSFRLKFSFSKTSRWDVSLFLSLEEGKPYVLQEWEIIEKGDGAGSYILYPQFIVNLPLDRLILPANYTNNRLRYWNQRNGPRYANPWTMESDWPMFGAYVGNMHLNNEDIILHSSQDYDEIKTGVHASSAFAHYSNWVHDSTGSPPYFQYDFWVDWESNNAPSSDIEIEVWVPDVLDLSRTQILYSPNGVDWHVDSTWTLTEGNRGEPGFSSYGGCKHRLLIKLPANIFTADDEMDSGTDYGDPRFGNDEYLLRLKIAYKDEGLATYEFEDSFSEWYGLKNIDDDWIWLMKYQMASLSVGLVPTTHPKHLVVQVDHTERYRNLTLGFQKSLASNGSSSFYTNLIMFYASDAARQDTDNDGVYNMFDMDLPQFSPISALSVSRESLGKINYEMGRFDVTGNYSFWNFSKESLVNEWNVSSLYTVSLSTGISQHLESDSAIFRFERDGYYVYDVFQSNEIRWKEETLSMQPTYELCAMIGLIIVGLVLSVRCRELIRKHWVILALFMVGFGIRLCLLSLAVDFSGNDAALYGHVAKNVVDYGKFQANIIGIEPHWITSGLWVPPSSITHPYGTVSRLLYPSLMTVAFAVLGKSFFALKSVDLILGSLLVPVTYYLAKKLFDVKTAILAAIIVVLHPLLIYYSGTHPGINIFPAFLATAALCFMVYGSKKAAVATGLCTGLLLLVRFEYAILLGGVILTYYIMSYKLKILKQRNFYIIAFVFLIIFACYFSYSPSLPISTKSLGGTMGEVRAPTLWETLSDPDFMQIRLYNVLYRYWYTLYEVSPLVFITAILGLLVNLKHWKKLSPLYLFPLYIIIAYSFVVREIPHQRFVVQLTPYLAILSAAFIVKLSLLRGRPSIGPKLQTKFRLKQTLLVLVFIEIISLSFFSHYLVINVAMRNLAWRFNDGDIYRWIRTNTPKQSIIMTSSGIRFAYYVEREIVDMPHPIGKTGVDLDMIVYIIKTLNVDYLVINRLVYNIPDLDYIRNNPLNAPFGFTLVYWAEDLTAYDPRILIYDVRALHG